MSFRLILKNTFIVAVLFLSIACSDTKQGPIKIGINPWPGYEFLYLAQEKGFYKELGVEVKIIEYGSLSDVRRGYERGNLDAMASTLIEVLQVKNNSTRNPEIFLVADFSDGGDVIIARNTIKNLADLKGKRIGADTASLPIFLLARALEKAGLGLADVEVFSLEQTEMEQAYIKNEIDVAVTYPPVAVRLQNRKDSHILFSSKEIPGEIVDVISAEASVIKERRQDIQKIMRAWDNALRYASSNPKQAHEIMAKREGISAEEFAAALGDLHTVTLQEQATYFPTLKQTLNNVRNVLVKTGTLSPDTSADCCLPASLN